MIAQAKPIQSTPASELADWYLRSVRPPRIRSILAFAEQEIVIPTGEYKGQRWKADRQPWTRVLFGEMDSGQWPTIVATGPSQSGKTQSCFAIPTLYAISELRENFVLGVPDEDMADKKWRTDLLPIMQASGGLKGLVPTEGPGSRGGKVRDTIQFGNGVVAAIMTRGSGDAAKAGFTARIVNVTEAADWSQGTETSEEADPLRQLRARQRAFSRHRRRLLVEGTVKIEEWLPWSLKGDEERLISSLSRLVTPCPHCGAWISPEREHFVGWQGAASEDQACNEATFICPDCNTILDDDDRRKANRDIRIVHHGQTIDEHGDIHGPKPPVSTLWFRYSQWHNLLLTSGDLAEDEWKASQLEEGTQQRDDAERELCQFQWCVPFRSTLANQELLKPEQLRKRKDAWPRNAIPPDTDKITIGVDLGKWTGWWVAIAWRANGQLFIPAYGAFDVCRSEADNEETRIIQALREFRDTVCATGFEGRQPDRVWIDGGYLPDSVAAFVRESGGVWSNNRFRMVRGRGKSVEGNNGGYHHPRGPSNTKPYLGTQWFAEMNFKRRIAEVIFNADYWKIFVHDRFRQKPGHKGSVTLFRADHPNEHAKLTHHICSEQLKRVWEPEKGFVEKWYKTGQNHLLDSTAMACGAGDEVGFRLRAIEAGEEMEATEGQEANWYAEMLA